jgi:SHS2 domain-containing protein
LCGRPGIAGHVPADRLCQPAIVPGHEGVGVGEQPAAGHRSAPHTADVRIEAWAPSRERCVAEAVRALVGSFADVSGAAGAEPAGSVDFRVGPGPDDELLVAVLDQVVYLLDTVSQVPTDVEVAADDSGLDVRLRMTDPGRVEMVGAVPKAVSLHELRFDAGPTGWSCTVTLDV